jgi:peptide/nickel transport system substrate-binding protein
MRLLVLLLAAVGVVAAAGTELHFALHGDPASLDPLHAEDGNSEVVRYLTAGVLLRVNRVTEKLQPELAESWKVSDGGRTITFHLRAGLQFSDGSPLTSEDVARTLHRAFDPKEHSPVADAFRSGDGLPEIRTAGPREVSIRYPAPKPAIEQLFDSVAITPAVASKLPVTAGPFVVAESRPGTFLLLRRNAHYWKRDASGKPLPYLESIRIDIQQNRDIELTRFLRGELDLINKVDADSLARILKEKPGAGRNLGASLDPEFLWFNQAPAKSLPDWKRKWFQSTAFRHAVSQAIHRSDLATLAYKGQAHPAAGPISSGNRLWFNAQLKPLPTDVPNALRLLRQDGFVLKDGVLKDRDGHAVEFSLLTNAGNKARERSAALIQEDLKKVGMRVNIVTLDFRTLGERIGKSLDYEAVLLGFTNVDVDPMEQMNVWLSSGPEHAWWPSQRTPATDWEARIDALEMQQASSASMAVRKKAVDEIQRIVVAEEPILYLVNPDYLTAISPSLKGVQPTVAPPQVLWNIEWLRLE